MFCLSLPPDFSAVTWRDIAAVVAFFVIVHFLAEIAPAIWRATAAAGEQHTKVLEALEQVHEDLQTLGERLETLESAMPEDE